MKYLLLRTHSSKGMQGSTARRTAKLLSKQVRASQAAKCTGGKSR